MKRTALYFGSKSVVVTQYENARVEVVARVDRFDITTDNLVAFWNALQSEYSLPKKVILIFGDYLGYWNPVMSEATAESTYPESKDTLLIRRFAQSECAISKQICTAFLDWEKASDVTITDNVPVVHALSHQHAAEEPTLVVCSSKDDSFCAVIEDGHVWYSESEIDEMSSQETKMLLDHIEKKYDKKIAHRLLISESPWNGAKPDILYDDTFIFSLVASLLKSGEYATEKWFQRKQTKVFAQNSYKEVWQTIVLLIIIGALFALWGWYLFGGTAFWKDSMPSLENPLSQESVMEPVEVSEPILVASESSQEQVILLPEELPTEVFNATTVAGLAGEIATVLEDEGFENVGAANIPVDFESVPEITTVYFRDAENVEAKNDLFTRILNSEFPEVNFVVDASVVEELTEDPDIAVIVIVAQDKIREE